MPVFGNVNGTWRDVSVVSSNVNGVWRASQPSCNVNGVWRNAYTSIRPEDVSWIDIVLTLSSSYGSIDIVSDILAFVRIRTYDETNTVSAVGNVVLVLNTGDRVYMSGGAHPNGTYDPILNAYATDRISTSTRIMIFCWLYLYNLDYWYVNYMQGYYGRDATGLAHAVTGSQGQFGLPVPARNQFEVYLDNNSSKASRLEINIDNTRGGPYARFSYVHQS